MELEKYETQGVDGGVVDMRCLPEDPAEGGCHAQNLDRDGRASPGPERTSCDDHEEATEAGSKRDGEDDCSNDEGDESSEAEDKEDALEDAKSDTSSNHSCSDEAPLLDLNYEALKHLVDHFLPGSHGACIDITSMRRGGFHEIRVLHFADGWSCIGRFTIEYEILQKTESELATIEYVRKNTTIPVPEIYFVNYNENHVVGAAFVLMERMDGGPLGAIWEGLSLEHRLDVVTQLANVTGQLAEQKFDKIGVITKDGTIGPVLSETETTRPVDEHAFTSTVDSYLVYLKDDPTHTETVRNLYQEVRIEIQSFFERNATNPLLHAPYRLMHGDYNTQNILVVQEDKSLPPKISAIIDWDWSQTIELQALYSYPGWIVDDIQGRGKDYWADNKVLRKHFVASLIQHYPQDSPERKLVKRCFREKSYLLNYFCDMFMWDDGNEEHTERRARGYLSAIRGEGDEMFRHPYDRLDWKMDSDLEESDAEGENNETNGGSDGESGSDSTGGSGDESAGHSGEISMEV